jgi:hypothetical protein
MSKTTVHATCAATIRLRVRWLSCVLAARVEFACSAACGATRTERRAGKMPNKIAAAIDKPPLKTSTGRLTCTSPRRGI